MTPRTLDATLRASAARSPEAIALRTGDGSVSYAELAQVADAIAAGLRGLGVRRGDRVAIALPNGRQAACTLFGALRAGAAVVPINPSVKADKLDFLLDHSDASVFVTTAEHATGAPRELPLVVDGDSDRAGAMPLSALMAAGPLHADVPIDLDLAAIIYTSGSTGRPKGVTLTHGNLTFVTASIVEYLEMVAQDRILSVLPLSFGYGLSQLLTCVHAGARLVLEPGFGYPGRLVELLASEQITGLPGVPTIFGVLASLPGLDERRFEHLRFLTNAGAALPSTTAAALRRCFPEAQLYAMYGQTECIRVCYLPPEQLDSRPESVGIPIPGTEVWIVDEDGVEVPDGEIGELVVRGAHVMQGYWKDPSGTGLRLREGRWPWERVMHTGDLFRRDAEGYLHFVSRTDDIIKSRGEKVAPREIEEVLHEAPGVAEAAVIGIPDELLGEAVEAHVAPQGAVVLDARQLRRFCAERLENHLVPRRVVIHDELPKSVNGKIDRLALAGRR
ncbi:MAG: acyl--CoA ligase [Actinomycetota bacterium]|nr:acyl--CoA ligase [Actinomycetota bacterium]